MSTPGTKYTEQHVLTTSFDESLGVMVSIPMLYNDEAGTVERQAPPLVNVGHDYIGITYPNVTTVVHTFRQGGAAGTVMAVLTFTYSDSTHEYLTSVARS